MFIIRFLLNIVKCVLFLVFSTTLLFLAAWNFPQTHDEIVQVKEFVEEQYQVDIDKKLEGFWKSFDQYRGIRRDF